MPTIVSFYLKLHDSTIRHCDDCRREYLKNWHSSNQKPCPNCKKAISYQASACLSCAWKTLWAEGKIDVKKIGDSLRGNPNSSNTKFEKGHIAWNFNTGFNTALARKIRQLKKYKDWRLKILEKDNYTCVVCKEKKWKLQVDHFPRSFASLLIKYQIKTSLQANMCDQLWSFNNGRAICIYCHRKTETYGKGYEYHPY